jgi:hypothetical protein
MSCSCCLSAERVTCRAAYSESRGPSFCSLIRRSHLGASFDKLAIFGTSPGVAFLAMKCRYLSCSPKLKLQKTREAFEWLTATRYKKSAALWLQWLAGVDLKCCLFGELDTCEDANSSAVTNFVSSENDSSSYCQNGGCRD